jgi:hypothetical protein
MTRAICYACGDFKFGAFVECKSCGERPNSDDDFVLSLAMTDHYFDLSTLTEMGEAVKSGDPPKLDSKTRTDLLAKLEEFKSGPLWEVISGQKQAQSKPTRKWWKLF